MAITRDVPELVEHGFMGATCPDRIQHPFLVSRKLAAIGLSSALLEKWGRTGAGKLRVEGCMGLGLH